ncbi:MAG: hypothetical protein KJ063_05130 [Anaerolineae bacterium]|nr:hypothetical protein [Anaerolineae bacterium]
MNSWLNQWRAFRSQWAFYRILRTWAAQQEGGEAVIAEFEQDQPQGRSSLRHFLQAYLSDETARQQLVEALENRHNQFINVVMNSQVGKIVNIAEAGAVYWKITVFSDVRQVVTFVGLVVLVAAAILAAVRVSQQPRRMKGDFNIAIASFVSGDDREENEQVAAAFSQRLAQFLDEQQFSGVEVQHRHIGFIYSAQEAERLATQINAHVVIYGSIFVAGDETAVYPTFWVVDAFQSDVGELNGESRLTTPIIFATRYLIDPTEPNITTLQQRLQLLLEFSKALVYLYSNNLVRAEQAINLTLNSTDVNGDLSGREIFYLFASHIARLQEKHELAERWVQKALDINEQYGRAYIAWANIAYDQGDFFTAVQRYETARQMSEAHSDWHLLAKASLGLANICSVELRTILLLEEVDIAAAYRLAECSRNNYEQVIQVYNHQQDSPTLQKLAAQAYYGMGLIYETAQQPNTAREMYQIALHLTHDPLLTTILEAKLKQEKE